MKKLFVSTALLAVTLVSANAQEADRYVGVQHVKFQTACHPEDVKHYDTKMLRERFVMEKVLADVVITEDHRSADYKTELQELVQRRADQHIAYELIGESGPDHNKTFSFRVSINGESAGEGSGRTKKEAEQMAACEALRKLKA